MAEYKNILCCLQHKQLLYTFDKHDSLAGCRKDTCHSQLLLISGSSNLDIVFIISTLGIFEEFLSPQVLLKINLQLQASSQVSHDPNLFRKPQTLHHTQKKSTFNLQIYESQIPQSYFPTKEVLQKHTVLADMKNTCIRKKKKKKQKQPIFEPIYV